MLTGGLASTRNGGGGRLAREATQEQVSATQNLKTSECSTRRRTKSSTAVDVDVLRPRCLQQR